MVTPKLARCGPLLDTVPIAASFLVWSTIGLLLVEPILKLYQLSGWKGTFSLEMLLVVFGWSIVLLIFALMQRYAIELLIHETDQQQDLCLYLRAFQTDDRSGQLRAWLKAALGYQFRLSGIRAPHHRASPLTTFFSPVIKGLRYLGSRQFELEAPDRNWLARLLASFAETRLVFVDMRSLSPNVMDEIKLSWLVFGPERMIFIVDDSRSLEDGQKSIKAHLGPVITQTLRLVSWPTGGVPEEAGFVRAVRDALVGVPAYTAEVPAEALAFVEARVNEEHWDSAWTERSGGVIILSLIASFLLGVQLARLSELWSGLLHLPAVLLQLFFWRAWFRAHNQRRLALRIHRHGATSALRLAGSALFMLPFTCVVVALLISF